MRLTPRGLRAFWLTVGLLNLILWPIATLLDWVSSEKFISHVSMEALVLAAFGAWQSTRVEVIQDEDANVQDVLDAVEGKS